jgi:hypothetical protein
LTGRVELGSVWAALPGLVAPMPQMPAGDPAWRRPLRAYPTLLSRDEEDSMMVLLRHLMLLFDGLPDERGADALFAELEQHYPTSVGVGALTGIGGYRAAFVAPEVPEPILHMVAPTGASLPAFVWPDVKVISGVSCPELDEIAPHYRARGERLVMPRLNGRDFLSPLMLWWVLLFGRSSAARYDPELWAGALDVNRSEMAVPIEAALAEALEALPELILDALTEQSKGEAGGSRPAA